MMYTFKRKAAGDVTMTQADGGQLLQIIGKLPAAKGIIEVAAIPAAIEALESAIARDEANPDQAGQSTSPKARSVGGRRTSAATREKPVSPGITSCAQGASPGLVGTPPRSSVFARFASTPSAAHDPSGESTEGEVVELHQRVWPLMEMLKRARDANEVVVWGV